MVKLIFIAGLFALGSGSVPAHYELTDLKNLNGVILANNEQGESSAKLEKDETAMTMPKQGSADKSHNFCGHGARPKEAPAKNSDTCCSKKCQIPKKITNPEEQKRLLTNVVPVDTTVKPNKEGKESITVDKKSLSNAGVGEIGLSENFGRSAAREAKKKDVDEWVSKIRISEKKSSLILTRRGFQDEMTMFLVLDWIVNLRKSGSGKLDNTTIKILTRIASAEVCLSAV
jgi:hypothetical protein